MSAEKKTSDVVEAGQIKLQHLWGPDLSKARDEKGSKSKLFSISSAYFPALLADEACDKARN